MPREAKTKKCSKCKLLLAISEFNKNQWYCRNCYSSYGKENREKMKRVFENWKEKNTERYLVLERKGQKRYNTRYPEKIKAHNEVNKALIKGKLAHLACEKCGNFLSEAHHWDYSKPLDVWWLCKIHHRMADRGKLVLYA